MARKVKDAELFAMEKDMEPIGIEVMERALAGKTAYVKQNRALIQGTLQIWKDTPEQIGTAAIQVVRHCAFLKLSTIETTEGELRKGKDEAEQKRYWNFIRYLNQQFTRVQEHFLLED